MNFIFIDTFALAKITQNSEFRNKVIDFIDSNKLTLAINILVLIEIYKWKSSWGNILDFFVSIPFVITKNIDVLFKEEVDNYPNEIELPVALHSSQLGNNKWIVKKDFEINFNDKISEFENEYRIYSKEILSDIINEKKKFLPEKDGKYSVFQTWLYLKTNLIKDLYIYHKWFIDKYRNKDNIIEECFKSRNIVTISIFYEYYIQNKKAKDSDLGDYWHLTYIPYYDYAILDNERFNLINRMKNDKKIKQVENLYNFLVTIKCKTYNLENFIKEIL